jgi:broad specificity phosphatase PhoE
MGKTIITCVRHAQGYHNLSTANEQLPDPDLTPLGEAQCRTLFTVFPSPENITHLVASPLRRTLYTCLLSFPTAVARGLKVLALPELQETSGEPCDTGTAPAKLRAEFESGPFAGAVDFSLVQEGWNSKTGRWSPAKDAIKARARDARLVLREMARGGDGDKEIIVVTHGAFLHYFSEDWDGSGLFQGTGWANTEVRSYEFADPSGMDQDASLVETEESKTRRAVGEKPLTVAVEDNLRAAAGPNGGIQGVESAKL